MHAGREGKLEGEEGREGERERRRRGKKGKGGSVKKNIQAHDIHTHVCTTMPTITCRFHTTWDCFHTGGEGEENSIFPSSHATRTLNQFKHVSHNCGSGNKT